MSIPMPFDTAPLAGYLSQQLPGDWTVMRLRKFEGGQSNPTFLVTAGSGRIINISSVSGQYGGTGRAAYGATKAGIISLTQTMAMELGPHGITANAIAPGPTKVPRLVHGPKQTQAFLSRMALKRYALPADIAAAMDLSTPAVKSLLSRARESLRVKLEQHVR